MKLMGRVAVITLVIGVGALLAILAGVVGVGPCNINTAGLVCFIVALVCIPLGVVLQLISALRQKNSQPSV
jgi:hypothetical protein